jgi:hypothetical protein
MKWFRSQEASPSSQSTFDAVHTPEHPYCDDPSCGCHINVAYHDEVQHPERRQTADEVQRAYTFFGIRKGR